MLIGAQGPVANAIRTSAASCGWTVAEVQRGDDPIASMKGAAVAVVLHAPGSDVALYETVLRAVTASLVTDRPLQRVVTVTPWPIRSRHRPSIVERYEAVEEEARSAGMTLVVLRHGLLVGSQQNPGPADGVLFGRVGPWLPVPGDGKQELRPLLVDDLAQVVTHALTVEGSSTTYVEGAETFTLAGLVKRLNGASTRVRGFRGATPIATALVLPGLAIVGFLLDRAGPLYWVSLLVAITLYTAGISISARLVAAQRLLPQEDFLLLGGPPRAEILGASLRRVGDEWGRDPVNERKRKRDRKRSVARYRATAGSPFIAGFLLILGSMGVLMGGHDALLLPTLLPRLGGLLLCLAGLAVAVGGGSLFLVGWPGRYVLAFVGAVVGAASLLMLVVAALVNGDPSAWTLIAFYMLIICLACCFALARRGWTVVSSWLLDNGPKILGSVAAGGVLALVGQLLYSSVYVPSAATPGVSVRASLALARPIGKNRMALDATIALKNFTKNEVNVLGGYYAVRLSRLLRSQPPPENRRVSQKQAIRWAETLQARQPVRGYATRQAQVVAERGLVAAPGTFLAPGEEIRRTFVVAIPRRRSIASLVVELAVARRRFEVPVPDAPSISQADHTRVTTETAGIEDLSWVHKVTRSARYIHTVSAFEISALPHCPGVSLVAWIDGQESVNPAGVCATVQGRIVRRLADHYGVISTGTSTEIVVRP